MFSGDGMLWQTDDWWCGSRRWSFEKGESRSGKRQSSSALGCGRVRRWLVVVAAGCLWRWLLAGAVCDRKGRRWGEMVEYGSCGWRWRPSVSDSDRRGRGQWGGGDGFGLWERGPSCGGGGVFPVRAPRGGGREVWCAGQRAAWWRRRCVGGEGPYVLGGDFWGEEGCEVEAARCAR